jgi:hypothetical protein
MNDAATGFSVDGELAREGRRDTAPLAAYRAVTLVRRRLDRAARGLIVHDAQPLPFSAGDRSMTHFRGMAEPRSSSVSLMSI